MRAWKKVKAIYLNALVKNWIICPGLQAMNMFLVPIDVSTYVYDGGRTCVHMCLYVMVTVYIHTYVFGCDA